MDGGSTIAEYDISGVDSFRTRACGTSVWYTANTNDRSRAGIHVLVVQRVCRIRIKLLNSLPYYAQTNGQAESSNKTLIKLMKEKIEEHPRRWHEVIYQALWAHRTSKHSATKVTPFELIYG
jgi:hypothetical protein